MHATATDQRNTALPRTVRVGDTLTTPGLNEQVTLTIEPPPGPQCNIRADPAASTRPPFKCCVLAHILAIIKVL
jgi:hypothetical protein